MIEMRLALPPPISELLLRFFELLLRFGDSLSSMLIESTVKPMKTRDWGCSSIVLSVPNSGIAVGIVNRGYSGREAIRVARLFGS